MGVIPILPAKHFDFMLLDWSLEKMTLSQWSDLLEIMEDRHGQRSVAVVNRSNDEDDVGRHIQRSDGYTG